jgi:hypothetical protein
VAEFCAALLNTELIALASVPRVAIAARRENEQQRVLVKSCLLLLSTNES